MSCFREERDRGAVRVVKGIYSEGMRGRRTLKIYEEDVMENDMR